MATIGRANDWGRGRGEGDGVKPDRASVLMFAITLAMIAAWSVYVEYLR